MQREKFQVQQKLMDFSSKIRSVVDRVPCTKHEARVGQPCWWIPTDGQMIQFAGICGNRSRQVYTGVPSAKPNTRPQKETRWNR